MPVMRRLPILGLMVVGFLAGTTDVASAQLATDRLSPAITSGLRFDQPAATVADWKPEFSVSAADLRLTDAPRLPAMQNRAQGIGFGVLAGLQRSTVDDEVDSETGNGLMLGAWVGGNKGGRVGFTGEFIYIMRKFDLEDVDGDGENDEFKSSSFAIPAVFHVNFGRGGPEDPMGYVLAGPVFTFLLTQKLNGEDLGEDEPFKGADIGVMVGGGLEIFRLAFEVRYNIGLRNISSEGETGDIKTRQLEFVVKFRFSGA